MLRRSDLRRLVLRMGLIALAILLGLVVIGLLIASVLLAFLSVASPAVATLLTAFVVTACGLLLSAFLVNDRRRHGGLLRELDRLAPGLLAIVRRRPMGAVGGALALGVVAEILQRESAGSNRRRSSS